MSYNSNSSGSKLKLSEKLKNFFYRFINYLGILFFIVVAIYILYICLPEFLSFCKDLLLKIIKSDYPILSKP